MSDPETITATTASRSFSELLHRVCYGGESFVIKKGNRLMARIVPVTEIKAEASAEEETASPAPLPSAILDLLETSAEPAQPATGDEAEFYRAWMEQVRKVEA